MRHTVRMSAALVVIDVQQEYFDGALPIVHPDRHDVLARVVECMRTAHAAGLPVVVVQHAEPGEDTPIFREGSPMFALHPAVEAEHRDLLFTKHYPGSFTGTPLADFVAERGVDELVICGFMTHMCCDSTARQAAHRDLAAVVLSDATGTIDLEAPDGSPVPARQVHDTELAVLASGFARVMDAASWMASAR